VRPAHGRILAGLLALACSLWLAAGNRADAAGQVGLRTPDLSAIAPIVQAEIAAGRIPGAVVLVGLGDHPQVKSVLVRWPSGELESWDGLAAGRYWTLRQGEGQAAAPGGGEASAGAQAKPSP